MNKSVVGMLFSVCCLFCSSASAEIIEITSLEHYEKELKDTSKQVFVQFFAPWCSPCRLVQSEEEFWDKRVHDKVKIIQVNIQKVPELCRRYEISSIPLMNMMDSQGNVLIRKIGSKSIVELLSSYEKSLSVENFSLQEFVNQTPKESG